MPEYLEFRCCMCPNHFEEPEKAICPPGPFGTPESSCRFVKNYIDKRGWKYRVMRGLGENTFKARYQKPEKRGGTGWHCVQSLPWRNTFDEAQVDLNKLAKEKGWAEYNI